MPRCRVRLLALLCFASAGAQAAKPVEIPCQSGTPAGELACLQPDIQAVETAVERQLYQVGKKLRESQRTKSTAALQRLVSANRSWKHYRDSYCSTEAYAAAGAGEWMKVRLAECHMRLTKDWLESLRDIEARLE